MFGGLLALGVWFSALASAGLKFADVWAPPAREKPAPAAEPNEPAQPDRKPSSQDDSAEPTPV